MAAGADASSFDFEEECLPPVIQHGADDYDMRLGIAISASSRRIPGSQILPPEDVQRLFSGWLQSVVPP